VLARLLPDGSGAHRLLGVIAVQRGMERDLLEQLESTQSHGPVVP
jgi:hypothetical protein